jgi:hypothetical protein
LFLIIVNVLGHPKGVGGLTSYFLRGGGMDVFWNDPLQLNMEIMQPSHDTHNTVICKLCEPAVSNFIAIGSAMFLYIAVL